MQVMAYREHSRIAAGAARNSRPVIRMSDRQAPAASG